MLLVFKGDLDVFILERFVDAFIESFWEDAGLKKPTWE